MSLNVSLISLTLLAYLGMSYHLSEQASQVTQPTSGSMQAGEAQRKVLCMCSQARGDSLLGHNKTNCKTTRRPRIQGKVR